MKVFRNQQNRFQTKQNTLTQRTSKQKNKPYTYLNIKLSSHQYLFQLLMIINNRICPYNGDIDQTNIQHQQRQSSSNNNQQQYQQSSQTIIKKAQLNNDLSIQQLNKNIPQPLKNQNNNNHLYTCRICLQQSPSLHANNQHQLKNLLQKLSQQTLLPQPIYVITTCKCQGTSGYVHQRCIIRWIDAQYKRTKQKQMKCQICLQEILYQKKTIPYFQFTIKNCQSLSPCNIVCFTSIVIVLAALIVLQTQSQKLELTDLVKLTIFILMAIFIVGLIFSIILIVKQTCYKKRKQTTKVFTNDQIEIKGIIKQKLTHYDRRSSTHRTQASGVRSTRTIRSARNINNGEGRNIIESRNGQRYNSSRHLSNNNRQQQGERSERSINNVDSNEQQSNQPQVLVRSLRVVRNTSARSIQVRSRQQLY